MKKVLLLILGGSVFFASLVVAAGRDHITKTVELKSADEVFIRCDLGAGEFTVTSKDMKEAAMIDIMYDSRRVDYMIDYEEKRGTCYIDLESEHRSSTNIDTDDNKWDIVLSKRYTTSIDMDIGACDANIDLGGIPLKELKLDVGAASGVLEFSEPNPIRLEELDIDAGASSVEIHQLGNANFEYFKFDGGVGSFDLDLRGEYTGESVVSIDIGLGSADITMPSGVPFRIETEGSNFLSSVDIHNRDLDEVEEDVYESDDFEGARVRIILEISAGLGSVDVYWE